MDDSRHHPGVQTNLDHSAGVGVLVGAVPLVQTAGGDLAQPPLRVGPGARFGLVQVTTQEQIDVIGQQPPALGTIGQVIQGVVDQGDAQAIEGPALAVRDQAHHLVAGQPQLAGIAIVPGQPGRVQADELQVAATAIRSHGDRQGMAPAQMGMGPRGRAGAARQVR